MLWDTTGAAEERHKMAAWETGPESLRAESGAGALRGPPASEVLSALKKRQSAAVLRRVRRCQKGKRARSRPETHPRRKGPQPPLLPDAAPQGQARPAEQPPRSGAPQPRRRVRRGRQVPPARRAPCRGCGVPG